MATDRMAGRAVHNRCPSDPTSSQMAMLERIAGVIAGEVYIDQIGYEGDADWIKFHVGGFSDSYVAIHLEANQNRLFDGQEIRQWQILAAAKYPKGGGLWLHDLKNAKEPVSHCGVWFY